jgi:acyl dehydratase
MVGFPMPSGLKLVLWTLESMPGIIADGWGTCSMKGDVLETDLSIVRVVIK